MQMKPKGVPRVFSQEVNLPVTHDVRGIRISNPRGEPYKAVDIVSVVLKREFANGVVERYDAKTGTWSEETT